MAEYVDKNKIKKAILDWAVCLNNPDTLSRSDALFIIDNVEAADVAPVVHGKWKYKEEWGQLVTNCCSICGQSLTTMYGEGKMNFCHNCGAKMDAEQEE